MTKRGWAARVPLRVRVPGTIALVLVGVLASSMIVGAVRGGEMNHGPSGGTEMDGDPGPTRQDEPGDHGPGRHNNGAGAPGLVTIDPARAGGRV